MRAERWQQVDVLFAEALARPADRRASYLADACAGDPALGEEVRSLLDAAERSGDFLTMPALDLFARQVSREGWSVRPGDRIASYIIERRLGAGGMGEVWQAHDERLGRPVAIKLLLPHPSNVEARVRAFQQEARAAGALNHPAVLTVYDIGHHRDAPFLVTECLDGESLRMALGRGALPVETALDVALQVARGLHAAHARGIVHRDLKPENIFVTRDGRVKILDFGIATLHDVTPLVAEGSGDAPGQRRLLVTGTAGYMAPEQMRGDEVDGRADLYALGGVLHEMITGHTPGSASAAVPPDVLAVIRRCLRARPADRYATAAEVVSALEALVRSRQPPSHALGVLVRRPLMRLVLAGLLVALVAGAGYWRVVQGRVRWVRTVAAPEITRLADQGDVAAAFVLAREALAILPDDPHVRQLWLNVSLPASITTEPAGAKVEFVPYRTPSDGWTSLGRTPLTGVRIPRSLVRVRISKPGFQTVEGAAAPPEFRIRLDPAGSVPEGMVRVPGGRDSIRFGAIEGVQDYWIDRHEVTNREFKAFVDAGGYRRQELWREPIMDGGRHLTWEEGLARFRDSTGQPGPSTWIAGSYPRDQADFPVGGVSWYEAAAYAAYAGRSLPTLYHWYRAAGLGRFADILAVSNFNGRGPAPVGSHQGIGGFGTFDMAGNVKEWCWNASGDKRFLLGGAWNEPRYMFGDYDAKPPLERAAGHGFRLAKYEAPLTAAVLAPIRLEVPGRDSRQERPVSDEIFEVYRRQYAYDHAAIDPLVEVTGESALWTRYTVVFNAAYSGPPMRLHLFIPRRGRPPYQTVAFFPGADAFRLRASRDMSVAVADLITGSGRALLYPVYLGTYERGIDAADGETAQRELRVAWFRDLGRSIDYLETRPDIDRDRLAFYGISAGGDAGVILTALESRIQTSILQGSGIWVTWPAEIDILNFAPRVRVPTMMLNGRYDFETALEPAQRQLFDRLGTAPEHKRHRIFETGHALPNDAVAAEILPWLDQYLGTVAGG